MSVKVSKAEMIERICALNPCHGRAAVERWMSAAPELVSARDVVAGAQSQGVSLVDTLWLAFRLAPQPVRDVVVRRAVLRARDHAVRATAGLAPKESAALAAVPSEAPYQTIQNAATAAARAVAGPAAARTCAARADAAAGAAAYAAYAAAHAATYAVDAAAATAAVDAATYAVDAAAHAATRTAEREHQLSDFLTWRSAEQGHGRAQR